MTTQIEAWAWELPYPNGTYLTDIRIGSEKPPFDPRKLNLRPLYSIRAALAQPEPPKRKPLTDDALDAKRYRHIIANGMPHQGGNCCWYLDWKRFPTAEEAIDYALDIKEKNT